jgi:DNA repair exonuclease SbcCD ATPase subunit
LSSFFVGQQTLEEEHEKQKAQRKADVLAGKPRNVTQEAIDNVMRVRQIRRYYADLEHMVRWELGMPDLWTEITEERDRLTEERALLKKKQDELERIATLKRKYQLQLFEEYSWIAVAIVCAIVFIIGNLWALQELVELDRVRRWGY